ncbi:MAG: dihydrofolate synthase [Bacteroidetes bacterium GWF2_42_66]|nr:MAG: dihydrofolate synthase [Bacteroidetes bacterium GWA2_42_15]OFX99937.1 MAG: dihydrofolate synthase [Bacteroidetes bacterium GWE2_42_39]OFY40122.1 MAG: dihydrofolate synthase [Bacteroidetes bacterium GWF2_42_66]HBL73945.1 dihydrofolate synthase [Prolixibacteraceae bacterium]HCR89245.1 dihydrofolate synthase [Prolixibacteraceae bacterium]
MSNYQDTIDYLYSQLPMYQRTGPAAYKDTLENTWALDKMYDHPHLAFKTIHVAGTNGKGSVSHMLASVLQEAGYKTGLYTSPHLKDFRERIRVNGAMIPEQQVTDFVASFREKNETLQLEPSFFELTVLMAFEHFRNEKVDIAVIEVGLGGRLDSTNIITPEVSVITNISLDHVALLGNTIAQIASEKAGIIKKQVPVVIGESDNESTDVFLQKATEMNALVFFADREFSCTYSMLLPEGRQSFNIKRSNELVYPGLKLDLLGIYQRKNILTVLKTLELLKISGWNIEEKYIYSGLKNVTKNTALLGRWQIVGHNPLIVCDTGHNEGGISQVVEQIRNAAWKNLHIVFGMVNDKSIDHVLALLPKEANYYFTRANIPRALDETELQAQAEKFGLEGKKFKSVQEALHAAKNNAGEQDMIFVGGSTFVVAEVL